MGSGCSKGRISDVQALKPTWTKAVKVLPEFLYDNIGVFTDGIRRINYNTIERHGKGSNSVDGLRWSRGFLSGKHVFEIIFPIHLRGSHACVGIGTEDTPLKAAAMKQTIGQSKSSWGVNLVTRKTMNGGKEGKRFPEWSVVLPDWFFMYLDLDAGTLQFGSDTEYYGTAFVNVHAENQPLYVMASVSVTGAIIGIVYRGEGKEVKGPLRKSSRRTASAS